MVLEHETEKENLTAVKFVFWITPAGG